MRILLLMPVLPPSKALTLPLSSGATESLIAMKCLQRALVIEPTNKEVVCALKKLTTEMQLQREKDFATFRGFLNRARTSFSASENSN